MYPYQNQFMPNQQMMQQAVQIAQGFAGYQPPTMQIVKVNNRDEVNSFAMGPNSSVALFHSSQNIFYLKTTDEFGKATVSEFDFSPRKETATLGNMNVDDLKTMIANMINEMKGENNA